MAVEIESLSFDPTTLSPKQFNDLLRFMSLCVSEGRSIDLSLFFGEGVAVGRLLIQKHPTQKQQRPIQPPLEPYRKHYENPLKRIRERVKITQAELAKRLGVHQRTLSRVENGRRMKQEILLAIIRVVGLPPDDPDAIALLERSKQKRRR